ncbi:unnamed protein product, partial [marine sediment metagenome]
EEDKCNKNQKPIPFEEDHHPSSFRGKEVGEDSRPVERRDGNHVEHSEKQQIPQAVIKEAALLAARFSKLKGETRVEVSHTPVKYVRKPKGAPLGLVILTQEDTLTVNPSKGKKEP